MNSGVSLATKSRTMIADLRVLPGVKVRYSGARKRF
jgi:hypothetical protein